MNRDATRSQKYASGALIHAQTSIEGEVIEWNARWHRKRRSHTPEALRSVSWWLTLLFTIGSLLFVVGGVATITSIDRPAAWMNLTGSLAFSIGASLAVVEAASAAKRLGKFGIAGLWATAGGRAALIQIVAAAGFFQIAMIAGVLTDLNWVTTDVWLWTPSTIGSIGFVASSFIAVQEARPAADIGTTAAIANLAGSVCFLLGSVAGYLAQGPIQIPGNDFANPVFLAGSVLFLAGSAAGFIELRQPLEAHQTSVWSPATPQ